MLRSIRRRARWCVIHRNVAYYLGRLGDAISNCNSLDGHFRIVLAFKMRLDQCSFCYRGKSNNRICRIWSIKHQTFCYLNARERPEEITMKYNRLGKTSCNQVTYKKGCCWFMCNIDIYFLKHEFFYYKIIPVVFGAVLGGF